MRIRAGKGWKETQASASGWIKVCRSRARVSVKVRVRVRVRVRLQAGLRLILRTVYRCQKRELAPCL